MGDHIERRERGGGQAREHLGAQNLARGVAPLLGERAPLARREDEHVGVAENLGEVVVEIGRLLGIVENEEEGARNGLGTGQGQRRKSQGRRRRLKAGKPYLGLAGEQTLAEGFELRMSGVERLERVNIHKNRAQKY